MGTQQRVPWRDRRDLVAAPFVDVLLSGHDLRSLEEFAALLPELSS